MIDVFLVHDDLEQSSIIRSSVSSNPELSLVSETQTGRDGLFSLAAVASGRPRLLMVRLNLADMNGFDMVQQVREKHPDVYIVPCLEGNEGGQVWQALLQMELRDVINGPQGMSEITRVLASAAPRAQAIFDQLRTTMTGGSSGECYMVAVISARGGLGKTVVATNLAASLATLTDGVVLVDFSLNPGDFAVTLDNVPRNSIMDAVQAGGAIDSELLQNLLAPHPLRFRYLACPNQEFDTKAFDYNIGHTMVHELRKVGQYVIIDTGMGLNEPTVAAADNCDLIFLITSRDVTRLLATQRYIKLLKERECPSQKIKVLVNQAEVGGEIPETEIESLLEHPVTAYLPSNPGPVAYSINSGVPIVVSQPEQPISVVLSKLAEYTLNRWQPKAEAAAPKPKGLGAKLSQRLR